METPMVELSMLLTSVFLSKDEIKELRLLARIAILVFSSNVSSRS